MAFQYTASPWQKKLHESDARIKVIWAGRRAGKGRAVLTELMRAITQASISPFLASKEVAEATGVRIGHNLTPTLEPQIHIWIVAPSYAQSRQAWNELKQFMPSNLVVRRKPGQGGGRGSGWNEDEKTVWLNLQKPNLARREVYLEIKSADDPESLQTAGPDFIWITESQDIKEAAWNKLRPMLNSAGRLGKACVEGIPPFSRSHWFARLYRYASENPTSEYQGFHATSFENVFLTTRQKKSIDEEKNTMPAQVWERMSLAKQPDGGGTFFRHSKIMEAATALPYSSPQKGRRYVAGLDLGKKQDYTVFIIKDSRSRASVYSMEMQGTDWMSQLESIFFEVKKWGIDDMRVDSTGLGDVIFDHLLASGLPVTPFKFTSQSKYQLFNNYYIALENETVTFPTGWTTLVKQLEDIAIRQSGNGGYIFFTEAQEHDDWVDAELLALMACDPPGIEGEEYKIARPIRRMQPLRPKNTLSSNGYLQKLKTQRSKQRQKMLEENEVNV